MLILRLGFSRSSIIAVFLFAATIPGYGGTFTVFGPQNYTRSTGAPVTVTNTFTVLNPSTQYTLRAFNGGLQDDQTELVSSTVVTVNGVEVIGPSDFNQKVTEVDVPVTLQASNTISVQVRGKPGGTLAIEIVGIDNTPPTISASASPSPNAAGWNDTNVTVIFTCNDAISGVASCPPAQTVTAEGANQIIRGTATDNAGNAATASVTLNIDKTPPTITANASPKPNSNGWNNSNVTVSFTCNDTLSGVANCPAPVTVSAEGNNQVITETATDVAGNSAAASLAVNLDKAPPEISITSPTNGATFTSSSISVTGSVSDAMSGVAAVTCNGAPGTFQNGSFTCPVGLKAGSNTITILATDLAGNSTSQSLSVTLQPPAQTPQIIYLVPNAGPVGSSVTIIGTHFGATQGSSTLTFNGTAASAASWSDTRIVVPVPSAATTGSILVTVAATPSNSTAIFTVGTPPTVSFLLPNSGQAGTPVTIVGSRFGATKGTSTVIFNGTPAIPTSWSDTSIVTSVPNGATTGPVVVTVGSAATDKNVTFTFGTPPIISSLSPSLGPARASIAIVGKNFGATQGTSTVTFNGIAANPVSWNDTKIVVPLPNGATTGPVVVTVGGVASNGDVIFTVGTPTAICGSSL